MKDIFTHLSKKRIQPKHSPKLKKVIPIAQHILTKLPPSLSLPTHSFHVHDNLIKIFPKDTSKLSRKIIAFDLDSTLIKTKSGRTFSTHSGDWMWCFPSVVSKLQDVIKAGQSIVIFSNQGAVITDTPESKSMLHFLTKIKNILAELEKNNVHNAWVYASTKQSTGSKKKGISEARFLQLRKPNIGMYIEFEKDYASVTGESLVKEDILYVGDAAGREADHSDSDLKFAENCGIQFKIPEDIF